MAISLYDVIKDNPTANLTRHSSQICLARNWVAVKIMAVALNGFFFIERVAVPSPSMLFSV